MKNIFITETESGWILAYKDPFNGASFPIDEEDALELLKLMQGV